MEHHPQAKSHYLISILEQDDFRKLLQSRHVLKEVKSFIEKVPARNLGRCEVRSPSQVPWRGAALLLTRYVSQSNGCASFPRAAEEKPRFSGLLGRSDLLRSFTHTW